MLLYRFQSASSVVLLVGVVAAVIHLCTSQTYCNDEEACYYSTLSDTYIYCSGYRSCLYADLTTSYDTYCNGYYGCYLAALDSTSDTSDAYCGGYFGCDSADINIDDTIYSTGYYSCYNADIPSGNMIQCNGFRSCYYSRITSITTVYGLGYYSLQSATIESTDLSYMYIYAYGYYAGYGASIYCYSGDICYIYCRYTGCVSINLYCYGTCYISCYDNAFGDICTFSSTVPTALPTPAVPTPTGASVVDTSIPTYNYAYTPRPTSHPTDVGNNVESTMITTVFNGNRTGSYGINCKDEDDKRDTYWIIVLILAGLIVILLLMMLRLCISNVKHKKRIWKNGDANVGGKRDVNEMQPIYQGRNTVKQGNIVLARIPQTQGTNVKQDVPVLPWQADSNSRLEGQR